MKTICFSLVFALMTLVMSMATVRAQGRPIVQGSTSQTTYIRIIDAADGTPETGVTSTTPGLDLEYVRTGQAPVDITETDLGSANAAYSSGGMIHVGGGMYRIDLPNAACAAGANEVIVQGTVTDMIVIPVRHPLVAFNLYAAEPTVNVTQFGGVAGTFSSGRPEVNLSAATHQQIREQAGVRRIWCVHPTTGNDANIGSFASPLATINEALSRCTDGDVIYLMASTTVSSVSTGRRIELMGRTRATTLTISGGNGVEPGSGSWIHDLTIHNSNALDAATAVRISDRDGIRFENVTITSVSGPQYTVYINESIGCQFRHCSINPDFSSLYGMNVNGDYDLDQIENNTTEESTITLVDCHVGGKQAALYLDERTLAAAERSRFIANHTGVGQHTVSAVQFDVHTNSTSQFYATLCDFRAIATNEAFTGIVAAISSWAGDEVVYAPPTAAVRAHVIGGRVFVSGPSGASKRHFDASTPGSLLVIYGLEHNTLLNAGNVRIADTEFSTLMDRQGYTLERAELLGRLEDLTELDGTTYRFTRNALEEIDVGAIVNSILLANVPSNGNPASSVANCLNAARAQGFGRWVINKENKTLTLYAPDKATPVMVFELIPNATSPTERTPK